MPRVSLVLLILLTGCIYAWTATLEPSRAWEGEEARRILVPCSRPAPRPVDSLWLPDTAMIAHMDSVVLDHLRSRWLPDYGGDWVLSGEVAGFYSATRPLVYGSYSWRRSGAPSFTTPQGTPFLMCDGGKQFFGVTYDPDQGRIVRLDYNVGGVVHSPGRRVSQ